MALNEEESRYVEELYTQCFHSMYVFARKLTSSNSMAEEAVQCTFEVVYEKLDKVRSSDNPPGYIVAILRNVVKNMNRARARLNGTMVNLMSLEGFPDTLTFEQAIDPEIFFYNLMTHEEFEMLTRVALDGYTIGQTAEEFGISLEACKKRIQRLKERIKKALQEHDEQEQDENE